jgi:hypothetical protein
MSLARREELGAELEHLAAKHGGAVGGAALERWLAASRLRAGAGRRGAAAYLRTAIRHRDAAALVRGLPALASPRGATAVRRARARRRVGRAGWLPAPGSS